MTDENLIVCGACHIKGDWEDVTGWVSKTTYIKVGQVTSWLCPPCYARACPTCSSQGGPLIPLLTAVLRIESKIDNLAAQVQVLVDE